MYRVLTAALVAGLAATQASAQVRVKDVADVGGTTKTQLSGYGIVVGLDGTGSGSVATQRYAVAQFRRMGIIAQSPEQTPEPPVITKSLAAVLVTAEIGAFEGKGSRVDVLVSGADDATSLRGGTLILTALRGTDGVVYATAQGPLSVGGYAVSRRPEAGGTREAIRPFTRAELLRIVGSAPAKSAGPLIALLATVGCRVGEAAALDVADWDPKTGKISITKTYSRKFGIGPPKSRRSYRTLSVPAIVRPILEAAVGDRTSGPLFRTAREKRVFGDLVGRTFDRYLRRLKIDRRTVHQLRHSVATEMVADRVPLGNIARYLGDSVDTIVKYYVHATDSDPVDALNQIFSG